MLYSTVYKKIFSYCTNDSHICLLCQNMKRSGADPEIFEGGGGGGPIVKLSGILYCKEIQILRAPIRLRNVGRNFQRGYEILQNKFVIVLFPPLQCIKYKSPPPPPKKKRNRKKSK